MELVLTLRTLQSSPTEHPVCLLGIIFPADGPSALRFSTAEHTRFSSPTRILKPTRWVYSSELVSEQSENTRP